MMAETFALKNDMAFFEVSPLCDFNVTESLAELSRLVLKRNGMSRSWGPNRGKQAGLVDTVRPEQNGRHLADNILKCIFMKQKFDILIQISPKFIPEGEIDNKLALGQTMVRHQTSDKPLSKPMLTMFYEGTYHH